MIFEPYPPSEVADGIWVGGRPSAATLEALKAAGVTHVLNVSTDPHDAEVRRNFKATWVPVVDDLEPKPASWFRRGLSFARRALSDPSAQLYVHCREGIHRGPLMTYVILRALRGLSPARSAAKDHRPADGRRRGFQRYTWSPPKRSSRRSPSRRSRRRSARRVRLAAGRRQDDGVGVGVSYSDPGACW